MDQTVIGEVEGVSQSYVSREIIAARKYISPEQLKADTFNLFTGEEVQYIQFLPRDIIADMQMYAFINDVLGVTPTHPFFTHYNTALNIRIAALASLGIQNKRLTQIFNKTQPTVSMIVKRNGNKVNKIQRDNRYVAVNEYKFTDRIQPFVFRKAGGTNYTF